MSLDHPVRMMTASPGRSVWPAIASAPRRSSGVMLYEVGSMSTPLSLATSINTPRVIRPPTFSTPSFLNPHSPDDALSGGALHADSDIGISTLFWIERGGDGKPGGWIKRVGGC